MFIEYTIEYLCISDQDNIHIYFTNNAVGTNANKPVDETICISRALF
jgi:hypothetical protein